MISNIFVFLDKLDLLVLVLLLVLLDQLLGEVIRILQPNELVLLLQHLHRIDQPCLLLVLCVCPLSLPLVFHFFLFLIDLLLQLVYVCHLLHDQFLWHYSPELLFLQFLLDYPRCVGQFLVRWIG